MNVNGKTRLKITPVPGGLRNLSPKTMAMIVLLTAMAILWGKVLLGGKDGPASVHAQEATVLQQTTQAAAAPSLNIEAVTLPVTPGRNDTLSCDFFSAAQWAGFSGEADARDNGYNVDGSEDGAERMHQLRLEHIAKRLTLEAVIEDADGTPFQAFVDGKILSVGSTLTVQEGPDQYVLTVDQISDKEIVFSWNQVVVVLQLPESFEL